MSEKLLLCSEEDIASVNIRDALTSSVKWEDDGNFLFYDDMMMMSIPGIHIRAENIDKIAEQKGSDAKEMIFLSRHKAASAIPTLTVHPIGNYHKAEFGGLSETLVKASPAVMTGLLRSLTAMDTAHYQVSFEVTHHGPFVSIPATFIEIGSDETQWGNKEAAKMLAAAILDHEENGYVKAIGIGGGHYAPRFTEVVSSYKINFGHMIPEYAFKDSDDDDLIRMITDAASATDTRSVYIHKRSMKGETARRVMNTVLSCGLEPISSSDLEPINGI
ncbi:MAG: D-aminoacyl-tRNA deacylase [Methanomassiliicoccaceae archaeon]|nr:D-aminoacyl-tRNA deacylase [Methanomassiliicoccaceae archaeon]